MDSPAELLLFIVLLFYPYLMAPALVLLNWLLTRYLGSRWSTAPILAVNLAISLLLFGPIRERGGGFVLPGDVYFPWYLDGSRVNLDTVWPLGLVMLCAVSVGTTLATLSRAKVKTACGNHG